MEYPRLPAAGSMHQGPGSTMADSLSALADDDIEACFAAGWTDGRPVVPPTRERVERMLGDWAPYRDEVIAVLDPGRGRATVEKIAANAVMAGCLPQHLSTVVEAVRAIAEPRFGLEDCVTTVHSVSPMLVVTGPVAEELGMNGGVNALGQGNRATATIGRALMLVIQNVGQGRPGGLDSTTLGHPGKFGFCITESPESPWQHLHADRGLAPGDSAVTAYGADAPFCICDFGKPTPEQLVESLAHSLALPGSYNAFFRDELWIVMSPEHADALARAGWSKADAKQAFWEAARIPAGVLKQRSLYGFADAVVVPEWYDGAQDGDLIPVCRRPEKVVVLCAGGPYGGYSAGIMGMGGSVTRRIEGPGKAEAAAPARPAVGSREAAAAGAVEGAAA